MERAFYNDHLSLVIGGALKSQLRVAGGYARPRTTITKIGQFIFRHVILFSFTVFFKEKSYHIQLN
jgi:hypothetical protein